jgi:hypothetical protein
MTSTARLRTACHDKDLANAPLGTAIAATLVAVLTVLLTFSQPVSADQGPATAQQRTTAAVRS